ncbi:Carboxylesterase NlhH [Actinomadura sp. RB99]|uniref:alpha/beta hydrolase n=1 Tax=Actinomadura sp. RB99 TaxID=2691577 RepID=UPI00168855C3|nr:alpha/beta hydrolase [Actinomadura sp. RB99]MBD2891981.1 Carboxylesterase NlhH [Actinomadura sp. RB99]
MDPELSEALGGMPYVSLADPVRARAAMRDLAAALSGEPAADARVDVADRTVPGGVPVRVYRPHRPAGPALVYFHGGGFVTGDLGNEHRRCLGFAAELGIVVVSVDYRLAPEHPFPAPFEDAWTTTAWTHAHAAELGADPGRIAVGGGSAGGGLAAAVALRARDEGGPPLAFQLLLYPVLDDRMDSPSMRAYTEPPLFNRGEVEQMWRHYLGPARGTPGWETPVYAAPARARDLSGLPPAYVLAAEADPLRDEDLAYALRMIEAGVPVELRHVPGAYHGFDGVLSAAVARRALADQHAALRRAFLLGPGHRLDPGHPGTSSD